MCCVFFDGYPNLGVCAVEMIVARKRGIEVRFSRFRGAQLFYSSKKRGNMGRFYRVIPE